MSEESESPPIDAVAAMYPENSPAPVAAAAAARSLDESATGADTPTTADIPVQAKAPEKYELALKGVTLDQGLIAEAEPVFRGLGLSNDQANALLPLAPKIMERAENAIMQRLIDAGAQQRKEWVDAFHADPAVGGVQRADSVRLAGKGLDAMGYTKDHPFRVTLDETGFGNHSDMIRLCRRVGELVGLDGRLPGGSASVDRSQPAWKVMYPDS